MSSAAFRAKAAKFFEMAEKRPEQLVRAVGLNLLRSVVTMSPVDTGRFRGNWQVQFSPEPSKLDGTDAGGSATISNGLTVLERFKLGMPKVFILNHLPYSIPLEYGHSNQAPAGMVRLTVKRFDEFVRSVVREMGA